MPTPTKTQKHTKHYTPKGKEHVRISYVPLLLNHLRKRLLDGFEVEHPYIT